jgi:hypothetical protein
LDFLKRQKELFSDRRATDRLSEENYQWYESNPPTNTLQSLFEQNKFYDGGWLEAVDDAGKTIKSCGAYLYQNSLVFGVRYCTFDSESKYSHTFINDLLPAFYNRALALGVDSMVLTVNTYNRHLPRMFQQQRHSEKTNKLSKTLLERLAFRGEHEFNHVKQNIYSIEFAINSDYWYKENHAGLQQS